MKSTTVPYISAYAAITKYRLSKKVRCIMYGSFSVVIFKSKPLESYLRVRSHLSKNEIILDLIHCLLLLT